MAFEVLLGHGPEVGQQSLVRINVHQSLLRWPLLEN